MQDNRGIVVRVPCSTSNLGSGFDVLGLALDMYLEVEARVQGSSAVVESHGRDAHNMPTDASNFIYKTIARHAGDAMPAGLHVTVRNEIPLTRGFGSSAAASVAAIAIGSWLKDGEAADAQALIEAGTGIEGHPDNVAPSVLGGLTVSAVVDDGVVSHSMQLPDGVQVVAIIPEAEISTADARDALPPEIPLTEAVHNLQRLGILLAGLMAGRKELLSVGVGDQIHQDRRFGLLPGLREVVTGLQSMDGCLGAFISGAGPGVIAFADANADTLGRWAVGRFAQEGFEGEFRVLRPDYAGIQVRVL